MNKPVRIVFGETVKLLANQYNFLACNADTKCCAFEDFGEYYPEREFSIVSRLFQYILPAAKAIFLGSLKLSAISLPSLQFLLINKEGHPKISV